MQDPIRNKNQVMNSKVLPILIGLVVLAGVAGVVYTTSKPSAEQTSTSGTDVTSVTNSQTSDTAGTGTIYTLADVAQHKDGTSCWTAINGGVYDLTQWIPQHPGGQRAILGLCGKDGSAAFNDQHGGMQEQVQVLATFKIGTLVQ